MKNYNEIYGNKIPPHSEDAEIATLGGMIMSNQVIHKILNIFENENPFFLEKNSIIYSVIINLYKNNIIADILTIKEELKRLGKQKNIGGDKYLLEINKKTPTSANVEQYAIIVLEKFLRRKLIENSYVNLVKGYDDSENVLDLIYNSIHKLEDMVEFKPEKRFYGEELAKVTYDEIIKRQQGPNLDVLKTSWQTIDLKIGGFERGDVVIIAGRPSMGKSHFAKNLTYRWSIENNYVGAYITLEMTPIQTMFRLVQIETGITPERLRNGDVTDDENIAIIKFMDKLHNLKNTYHVEMIPSLTSIKLKSRIKELVKRFNLRYLVIDHVGIMKSEKSYENKAVEMGNISNSLKQLALELNVTIFGLVQINRESEKQTNKRPNMANLKHTGAYEEDADTILLIHRPEYYGEKFIEVNNLEISSENITEIIIAKNRNGGGTSSQFLYSQPDSRYLTELDYKHLQMPYRNGNVNSYDGEKSIF